MFLNRIAAIILLLFCLLSLSAHVHLLPQQSTNPCPDKKVSNVLHIVRRSSSDPGYSIDNDCKLYLSHGSALGGGHDAVLVDRNGNMDGLAQHSNGFDSLHDDLAERSNGFGSLNDKSVSSFDSDEHHLSSRHHFEPPDGYPVSFPTEGRPYEGDLFMHDDHHGDEHHHEMLDEGIAKGDSLAYSMTPGQLHHSEAETHENHMEAEHALQEEAHHLAGENHAYEDHDDGEHVHVHHHHYHHYDDHHDEPHHHDDDHNEHGHHDEDEHHDDKQHEDHHDDHEHEDHHHENDDHHHEDEHHIHHHHDDNNGYHDYHYHDYRDNDHHDDDGHHGDHDSHHHHSHDDSHEGDKHNHQRSDHHEPDEDSDAANDKHHHGDVEKLNHHVNEKLSHPDAVYRHIGHSHLQKEFSEEEKNPYHQQQHVDHHKEPSKDLGDILLEIEDNDHNTKEDPHRTHNGKNIFLLMEPDKDKPQAKHRESKIIALAIRKLVEDARKISEHLKLKKSREEEGIESNLKPTHDSRTIDKLNAAHDEHDDSHDKHEEVHAKTEAAHDEDDDSHHKHVDSHDKHEKAHDKQEDAHDKHDDSHDKHEEAHDKTEAAHDKDEAAHDKDDESHHKHVNSHDRQEDAHDKHDDSHDKQERAYDKTKAAHDKQEDAHYKHDDSHAKHDDAHNKHNDLLGQEDKSALKVQIEDTQKIPIEQKSKTQQEQQSTSLDSGGTQEKHDSNLQEKTQKAFFLEKNSDSQLHFKQEHGINSLPLQQHEQQLQQEQLQHQKQQLQQQDEQQPQQQQQQHLQKQPEGEDTLSFENAKTSGSSHKIPDTTNTEPGHIAKEARPSPDRFPKTEHRLHAESDKQQNGEENIVAFIDFQNLNEPSKLPSSGISSTAQEKVKLLNRLKGPSTQHTNTNFQKYPENLRDKNTIDETTIQNTKSSPENLIKDKNTVDETSRQNTKLILENLKDKNTVDNTLRQQNVLDRQIRIISKALRDNHRANQLKTGALKELSKTPLAQVHLNSEQDGKFKTRRYDLKEHDETLGVDVQDIQLDSEHDNKFSGRRHNLKERNETFRVDAQLSSEQNGKFKASNNQFKTNDGLESINTAVGIQHHKVLKGLKDLENLIRFSDNSNMVLVPTKRHKSTFFSTIETQKNNTATTEKEELVFEKANQRATP